MVSVEEKPATASGPTRCEGQRHVVAKLDSAGDGVCKCGNYRFFGQQPYGGKNVPFVVTYQVLPA